MDVKRHDPLAEVASEEAKKAKKEAMFVCVLPPHAHVERNTIVLTKEDACAFIASLAIQLATV